MNVDKNTYITVKELADNELVTERLQKHQQLIVIDNNKPLYVISSMEVYKKEKASELDTLLSKVGKKIFVEYFTLFRDYEKSEGVLPIEYSLNSRRVRSSAAKSIFKLGLETEALKEIVNSQKLSQEVKEQAKELLKSYNVDYEEDFSLSYVAKNILPKMLNEKFFFDEIEKFSTREYTKEVFSMYYPLIVLLEELYDIKDRIIDKNKYPRYYKEPITLNGQSYLLCSQWNEKVQFKKVKKYITKKLSDLYIHKSKTRKNKDIAVVLKDYYPYLSQDMKDKVIEFCK